MHICAARKNVLFSRGKEEVEKSGAIPPSRCFASFLIVKCAECVSRPMTTGTGDSKNWY